MGCTIGLCQIERTSLDDLSDHETHSVHCGYGISIDAKGRVWTAGMSGTTGCVSRFDPANNENVWVNTASGDFNRGVAVGAELSAGFIWAASTNGDLIQVDPEAMTVVKRQHVGSSDMVGVAIDYEGYVWTVSQGGNAANKVHPGTWDVTTVQIGSGPYTYSDMTGMQLRGVLPPPK
jgi:streptogramin lyase